MRIRFSHQATRSGTCVNKFTFFISHIETLHDFLLSFLREIELFGLFPPLTSDSRIGFEVFSNVIIDSPPIYIPLRKREFLHNDDLIHRLSKVSVSKSMFIDLDSEFEVAVGIVNLN